MCEKEYIDCFPIVKRFLNENNIQLQEKIQKNMPVHLEDLKNLFEL